MVTDFDRHERSVGILGILFKESINHLKSGHRLVVLWVTNELDESLDKAHLH